MVTAYIERELTCTRCVVPRCIHAICYNSKLHPRTQVLWIMGAGLDRALAEWHCCPSEGCCAVVIPVRSPLLRESWLVSLIALRLLICLNSARSLASLRRVGMGWTHTCETTATSHWYIIPLFAYDLCVRLVRASVVRPPRQAYACLSMQPSQTQ